MKPQQVEIVKVAVIGGVALFALKKISDFFKQTGGKSAEEKTNDIEKLPIDANKLQFLPTVYDSIADNQYWAMNRAGTDEAALFESLKNLNTEDLKAVYKAFGVRRPTTGMYTNIPVGQASDIVTWYVSELSGSDLADMRKIWANTKLWK